MKKVLILITKSNWGGAQRYVFDLATKLPKDRYAVEVMAGGNTSSKPGSAPLIEKLQSAGIKADTNLPVGRDVKLKEDIKAFFKLCSILRHKKPDVLHVNSSKIGGIGCLAGRIMRVPKIVFTVHGWAFNENRPWHTKILIFLSYWVTLILSHETIIVSEASRKQCEMWPFVRNKITVVPHGIENISRFSQANARHALIERFPFLKASLEGTKSTSAVTSKNIFWIGTVAELHHIKGYDYAIKALREILTEQQTSNPKLKIIYTIIGNGEEHERIQKMITEMKLEKNVFLLGHIDNAAEFMQAFDVFLLPSLSEAFGYVLLEAGLAHTAVVATAVGGIPEIIEDMNSGILVQARKSGELAHALSFLIEHPEERKKYGNNLKEKVTQKYSIQKMIEATIEVYG